MFQLFKCHRDLLLAEVPQGGKSVKKALPRQPKWHVLTFGERSCLHITPNLTSARTSPSTQLMSSEGWRQPGETQECTSGWL